VVNAPGTTSTDVLRTLADAGATQVEPGHGLTGTTPLHAVRDLPEVPAMLYLTEVSHHYGSRAYVFGGGLYIDPVFEPYQVRALVGGSADEILARPPVAAELPPPSAIDYYGQLDASEGTIATGDTVIFGFRAQAFFTRAFVVPLSGVSRGQAAVEGVWTTDGRRAARRGDAP
jgi:predicted amino acid racemase